MGFSNFVIYFSTCFNKIETVILAEDKGHYKGEIMEGDIKVNKRFKDIIDKGKLKKDVIVENYRWKSTTIPFVYDASASK